MDNHVSNSNPKRLFGKMNDMFNPGSKDMTALKNSIRREWIDGAREGITDSRLSMISFYRSLGLLGVDDNYKHSLKEIIKRNNADGVSVSELGRVFSNQTELARAVTALVDENRVQEVIQSGSILLKWIPSESDSQEAELKFVDQDEDVGSEDSVEMIPA